MHYFMQGKKFESKRNFLVKSVNMYRFYKKMGILFFL